MSKVENAVLIWGPVSSEGINYLRFQGKEVVVCENRPYLLGLRHNHPLRRRQRRIKELNTHIPRIPVV